MDEQKPISSTTPPAEAESDKTPDLPGDYDAFLRDIKAQIQSA